MHTVDKLNGEFGDKFSGKANAERAVRIAQWRETLSTMGDERFFEIMHMYLGEIRTPFNKQNLIERLSAFLKKSETQRKIASLLSEGDLEIVAAASLIDGATTAKLYDFFQHSLSPSKVYERVVNLEERLILYRCKVKQKELIRPNPHLDGIFEKFDLKKILVKNATVANENRKRGFFLTDELLASFSAFVQENGDLCKADGKFKKRAKTEIERRFGNLEETLQTLKDALENLSAIKGDGGGKLFIDSGKMRALARLPKSARLCYVCAASCGRFSRNQTARRAQILAQAIASIPPSGYTMKSLLRSAYLASQGCDDRSTPPLGASGRFARIMQKALEAENPEEARKAGGEETEESLSPVLYRLFSSAAELGLLRIRGIEADGADVFVARDGFLESLSGNERAARGLLSIDAGNSATVLPGIPFGTLTELFGFMEIRKFDTAVSLEITKKSVMRAFDCGLDSKKIVGILEENCPHPIPQSLLASIEDWQKDYSSISLYKGYVISVSGENAALSERNPKFSAKVLKVLAPSVFLMDFSGDSEAKKFLDKCGAGFVGKIGGKAEIQETAGFSPLNIYTTEHESSENESKISDTEYGQNLISGEEERSRHFEHLRQKLREMDLTKEEYECLLFRINKKIILDESQLKKESVKFAKVEAGAMDFSGKVHIISQALGERRAVEVTLPSPASGETVLTGIPLSTRKTDDDVLAALKIDGQPMREFSVAQATKVRRVYSGGFS